MTKCSVSIITSTYNRATEISRAIDSILAQTCQEWELCIVGDCTPDNTRDIVRSFNDDRIRFYNLPEKSPAGAHGAIAKNYAIKHMAKGKYIAYLDDDDAYRPKFLETMIGYMEDHPYCEVAYCRGGYKDVHTGKKVWGNPFQRWLHGYSREKLLRYNYINTNWVVHRKSLIEKTNGWNAKTYFDDYNLWLEMSALTDFHYINKVLVDNYIEEDPFVRRAWNKGWAMIKSGGKRMPLPYDGDYDDAARKTREGDGRP
ncbi:MAG: glycosyltransferase family 2 protein [Bacteroidia bacterium]|nr:glycosyltransferase family 2 protein [Bacteroidia bacterium]